MKEVMESKYLSLFIYLFFLNTKNYFIYFNDSSLYNTSNIKGYTFHITTKNYSFFIHLSLSLSDATSGNSGNYF